MTVCGTQIPNLIFFFITRDAVSLRDEIIDSRFLSIWVTQQLNTGSWLIPCASDYSSTWMGWDSLRSDSLSHVIAPYFHWTHKCQPFVVFCDFCFKLLPRTTTSRSTTNRACPSVLWSNIDPNKSYWCPSLSHLLYILYTMTFVE